MDEPTKKPNLATPIAVVVAGALIAGAILYGQYRPSDQSTNTNNLTESELISLAQKNLRPLSKADHQTGPSDADVTIVEYSDLECPFCKIFHQTMLEFTTTHKVAWVFRHFPLESLHPKALAEAVASECAYKLAGNTGFWNFINQVFEITPSNNGLDSAKLPEIAKNINLDLNAFNTCLDSQATLKAVEADLQNAIDIGAMGTPFISIIGKDKTIYPISNMASLDDIKDETVKQTAKDLFDLFQTNIAKTSKTQ